MKDYDLLEAIGGIDEKYINNAGLKTTKRSKKNYFMWVAAAACLCIFVSVFVISNFMKGNDDSKPDEIMGKQGDYASIENGISGTEEKANTDYAPMIMVNGILYKDSYEEFKGEEDEYRREKFTSYSDADVPSQDGEQNFDRTLTSEYFIIDKETIAVNMDGVWRLFKASDKKTSDITKEQSDSAYGVEVQDAPVDESTYSEARTYSEEILDLQNRISAAMSNHELPFVTGSMILENPDRICVTVNTQDEGLIDQLKSYNTSGVELEIEYVSGIGTEE